MLPCWRQPWRWASRALSSPCSLSACSAGAGGRGGARSSLSILSLASQALGGPPIPLVGASSSAPWLPLVILVLILAYYLGVAGQFGLHVKPKAIRVARIAALSVIPVVLLAGLMLGRPPLHFSWPSQFGGEESKYYLGHV